MNPPNLQTVALYTLTLREVIHSEALIYTMPTVAAGGGHILNIDFFSCKFVKEATGQRAARKDNTLLTMKKKEVENKEKKLFLNKEKLRLLLKLWQIRRQNWRHKVQSPPLARRVARRVLIVQSDGALNKVIK